MFNRRIPVYCFTLALALGPALAAQAEDPPGKKYHVPAETFEVAGRPAFAMLPKESLRTSPQPWVWYFITLQEYPDVHEKWMDEQFVNAGVAVAGIDVGESYGSPAGNAIFVQFYEQMTGPRNFDAKPCLLGRSRGGLQASSWAIGHVDSVAGIAGIYPVFDLRSFPGIAQAAPAYQRSVDEMTEQLARLNPIAQASVLAKAKVPVFIIHGDDDKVVPLEANSAALQKAYDAAGAKDAFELLVIKGQGHNYWEGFFRCQQLIDFAIARAKADAKGK